MNIKSKSKSMNSDSSSCFLLNYKKHNYTALEQSLNTHPSCLLTDIKHYIPLYQIYFSLNTTNYNSISLNHKYILDRLDINEDNNINTVTSEDIDVEKKNTSYSAFLLLSDNSSSEKVRKNIFLNLMGLVK